MRTAINLRSISTKTLRGFVLGVAVLGMLAGSAQAAPAPTPGLKVLAISAPTHLPPEQSEIQRVTVEAEGGEFRLGYFGRIEEISGLGTPVVNEGHLSFTAGSPVATIESVEPGAAFEVGDRVTFAEEYEFGVERLVVSCSSDCKTPGSTVTFSESAEAGSSDAAVQIFTKRLSGVTAEVSVGQEVEGIPAEYHYFSPGTMITAIEGETITLSNPTGFEYLSIEGAISFTAKHNTPEEMSASIAYDAAASEVQEALEALPRFGPGSLTVEGGPGGDAEDPYYVDFGGSQANQNVEELEGDGANLTGEHSFIHVFTMTPGGAGTGEIVVLPANVGGLPTSTTITAKVGPLPQGIVTSGPGVGTEWHCPAGAGESTVTCTTNKPLRIFHSTPYTLAIPVEVQSEAVPDATVPVELSDGGASEPSTYQLPIVVSKERAPFGVAGAWAGSFEADGSPSVQAGGHPYDSAAYIMLNTVRNASGGITPAGDSKDVVVNLPPGFVGNPLAVKRCPQSTLLEPEHGSDICNAEMSVGNLDPLVGALNGSLPFESHLYDDMPPRGVAAEFTTRLVFPLQSVLANVNSEEDFGIRLIGPNNANFDKIYGVFTAFEGVPVHGNGKALLTSPTNCAESAVRAPIVRGKADTYQTPGTFSKPFELEQPALVGCDKLHFEAFNPNTGEGQVAFSFTPSSAEGNLVSAGSTPVGAVAHLHIGQGGLTEPHGLATPELKRSVIKLPEGMSLNPSSAAGLEGCSEEQIGYKGKGFPMPTPIRFNEEQPRCPNGSKLGTAEIQTPLLDNPLVGEVFLADQGENPFGSLLAVYLVVNDPLTGVLIKLPGEVQANPVTGRLTTVFDDNPQLPFEDLYLRFRGGGPRSEFATSEVCGSFPTEGEWTPWSAPESGPPAQTTDSFNVSSNCASSPQARPFSPSFEAGTTGNNAGGYNPLVIKVVRKDGEQELKSLDFTLPPGVTGKLAGIPYCSEAQIAEAEHKTGREEKASSSCPAASELGTVDTAAGVGSEPFHVQGHVYLAGPYKGAPLSSVVVTPAVAGPLDLGDVVVRAPLYVNPETAQLTAKSDQIPTILRGIPLKIRSVDVDVDRQGFILNPTDCTPMGTSASIGGNSGAIATPSSRFQVAGCRNLPFEPNLKLKVIGGTKRNAKPKLRAELTAKPGEANIATAQVNLPHSEFLEQDHIKTVCTRVQWAEGDGNGSACPPGSIYGKATAWSPLLEAPLRGNVYLRSNGGERKLPDLVAALDGQVDIALWGKVDSGPNHGIRNTFEVVPDAPVSRFVLEMAGGKKGLLVNSENLCAKKAQRKAIVRFTGQNGAEHNFKPKVQAQCKKQGAKGKKQKGHKKSGKRK